MNFSSFQNVSFRQIIIISIILRVVLIFYSEWHDRHAVVKYTDIDYHVFTDAAGFLLRPSRASGGEGDNVAQGILGRYLALGE